MGDAADAAIDQAIWGGEKWGGGRRPRRRPQPRTLPADAETRALRQLAHRSFDRIWLDGCMTREQAYRWLATTLGVSYTKAHMGRMLDHGTLKRVVEVSDDYVGTTVAQDDFPDDLT